MKKGLGFGVWGLVVIVALGAGIAHGQQPAAKEMTLDTAWQNVVAVGNRASEELLVGKEIRIWMQSAEQVRRALAVYQQYMSTAPVLPAKQPKKK